MDACVIKATNDNISSKIIGFASTTSRVGMLAIDFLPSGSARFQQSMISQHRFRFATYYPMSNRTIPPTKDQRGFPCPCCGYLTRSEEKHGTFEICPVCNWEDDDSQFENPSLDGGANRESLLEAKENYKRIGAISQEALKLVRQPLQNEIPSDLVSGSHHV